MKIYNHIVLDLPKILQDLFKESHKLYQREALFTDITKYPKLDYQAKVNTLSIKIFSEYGVNVGVSRDKRFYCFRSGLRRRS